MMPFDPTEWAMGHLRQLEDRGFKTQDLMEMTKGLGHILRVNYETRTQVQLCKSCPKFAGGCQKTYGAGSYNAPIMIVGQGPGPDDAKWSTALAGTGGFLLTLYLEKLGIDRRSIYVTNLIKCHQDGVIAGNVEAETCFAHLANEIDAVQPAVIVTLGQMVPQVMLGDENFRLFQERGKPRDYIGRTLIPTFSMEYLLDAEGPQQAKAKQGVWEDLKLALDEANRVRPNYEYQMGDQQVATI